jgi:hypothetical protein
MQEIERLAAIEEIKQLRARYWRLIDNKDYGNLGELFAPDAWFDSAEALFDPVKGHCPGTTPAEVWRTRDVIAKNIAAGMPEGLQSAHMGHTPEIAITSETTATGIHPFNDRLILPGVLAYNGYGYYQDTYEKIDGKWLIKTSKIKRLRVVFDE